MIDQGDYQVWIDNFGQPLPGGAGAAGRAAGTVPEPSTIFLALVGLGATLATASLKAGQLTVPIR